MAPASRVQRARARLYDAAIVHMTAAWYRAVLERLPADCHLLDVGIGTAGALLANAALLREKRLRVTGVDIDAAYVERARRAVAGHGLEGHVEIRLESIYDHAGGPYGDAYFSGSFMLLPDPAGALRHVAQRLVPGGRIYFTQTFEHGPSPLLEIAKPLLRLATTIDFGRVTYEERFGAELLDAGVELEELVTLEAGRRRSSMLAVAKPSSTGQRSRTG